MIIKIIYNNLHIDYVTDLAQSVHNEYPDIDIEIYNEDHYRNQKKAIVYKVACGTKQLPLIAVYEDKELVKAFYKEDNTNNAESIKEWIKSTKQPLT